MVIALTDVWKSFDGEPVLQGLTMRIPKGMNYVIMGRSGCGKSVTLRHIIGILRPDQGSVVVDGLEVPELNRKSLAELRKRMGYLFQNGALINWLSVFDNIALPLREHASASPSEIRDQVMDVLQVVGMEQDADKIPPEISGGMRLRAGLARALVTEPEYVLYDEPNAGLDPIIAEQIHGLIVEVRDRLGVTGLIVTHSQACARTVGDRIGIMNEGRIVEEGSVEEMEASPTSLVRSFLSSYAD